MGLFRLQVEQWKTHVLLNVRYSRLNSGIPITVVSSKGKARLMRFRASSLRGPVARVQAPSSVFLSNDAILEGVVVNVVVDC
jgi:hypothetical protein